MCLICIDWQRGSLTTKEAVRNYREMVVTLDEKHADKLADELQVALLKEELDERI
jgi:hypothetical protein